MHGRLKVRTTEEQKLQNHIKQQQKLCVYRECMNKILSERNQDNCTDDLLVICTNLLRSNPDIYTLWNFRKEVVLKRIKESAENEDEQDKLKKFLADELSLTEECLRANPKSYGSWYHRYWILLNHPEPNWQNEFDLCNKYLKKDDRNFHCWDFRRLIVNRIGITLTQELAFSTECLNANFSNYSSWHYRSILQHLNKETVDVELTLIENAVFTDPADTSAWFYLRWILSNSTITAERKQQLLDSIEELEQLEPDCKWILLSKCWLNGSLCLNDKNYIDKRVQYYKRLVTLDPLRKGQYEDYLKTAEENNS